MAGKYTKARTLEEVISDFSEEDQRDIRARTAKHIAEEYALRELRKQMECTQEELAEAMQMKQGNLSRLEARKDMKVSTLRDYIEALGGQLKIIAELPGRDPVVISGFEEEDLV